jgi:hypothetical protein
MSLKTEKSRRVAKSRPVCMGLKSAFSLKAHTDRTRFGNATRIFSFEKQIKPSTDKNFTRYADQIAKIA